MVSSKKTTKDHFRCIAEYVSRASGSSKAFAAAILSILAWGASGFFFDFNQTWQLIINTGTTIGTFLMVILVQNTQTRESRSIQLKLDELLYGTKNTRNILIDIEDQSDEELQKLQMEYQKLREQYVRGKSSKSK